ncbi:MAG TPA: hypothetical protein H9894_11060 [Candidatus Desulfovibrio intestinipullorum]|uniref:Uncharacterized protein n=1 Tax=Candidatus Desulfovibrio intestinipullorum TaxID=2838536 RepID=A0A9D1PZ35_9BACT|nr:hypothetical protein [Candidatus Desulfovibrio intestinipullorum]
MRRRVSSVKGMEQGLVACTGVLSRELRRGFWLPASAAEEQKLWDALLEHARKGSWTCLHELFLHLQKRPGFWNLPMADDTMALAARYAEQAAGEPIACMLWNLYFDVFAPFQPEMSPYEVISEARDLLHHQPELIRLRCLVALDDYGSDRQQQAIEDLRRCRQEAEPGTQDALDVTTLLAMLPHSGKDNLREPDTERLEQLALLGVETPELLTGYLWQGIVCNEGTSWQDNWFNAMDDFLVPEERYTSYMEGLLCLHGFGGRIRDADRALALLARSAQAHFVPALSLLADITGRGLYGCKAGPYQGTDWVAMGCQLLVPRALAVHGLLNMSSGERLTSTTRLLSATREELFDWCGRQDQDCLCQACNAVFRLEVLVRQGARLDDPEAGLEANEAGAMLADALCLAQATADAGTFLYAGRELVRLATESLDDAQSGLRDRDKDRINAWGDRTASPVLVRGAETCLVHLTSMSRRKTRPPKPSLAPCLPLLAFFCLDRARFFGEPGAEDLLASFSRTMDTKLLMDNVEARNLNTPLRCFWCKTEHLIL